MTGFAKRGLIHASDFATLMRHNFIIMWFSYEAEIYCQFSVMIAKSLHKISEL